MSESRSHRGRHADGWIGRGSVAFDAFYREHIDAVECFIARRVASAHLAADLTADVFLAAIQAAESYDPTRGTERSWLYGIARHRIANSYRNAAIESRANRVMAGSELLDDDDYLRIHERLDAEAAARDLYARLRSLPEPERAVLELVALDDLTVGEAASALGITAVAARVRLHRARRRFEADAARIGAEPNLALDLRVREGRT